MVRKLSPPLPPVLMFKTYYFLYLIYKGVSQDATALDLCGMDEQKVIDLLTRHEGESRYPYVDTVGKITIGIGRNITDRGISVATMNQMLLEDIELAKNELDKIYPPWCELSENRQLVLIDMCFNLGSPRYLTFVKFWSAVRRDEWDKAATEMLDSRWSQQVGQRAVTLANMMRGDVEN